MHTFVQKPKATQQAISSKSTMPNQAHRKQGHMPSPILHTQDIRSNQTTPQTYADVLDGEFTDTALPNVGHNFSRTPIHTPVPATIQTKLTINTPGDAYEQEADQIADQVMRMAEPTSVHSTPTAVQRKCTECEDEEQQKTAAQSMSSGVVQRYSMGTTTPPVALQGVEGQDEEYPSSATQTVVLRKAERTAPQTTTTQAAPTIADQLTRRQGRGEPLAAVTQQSMETAFGYDFSRVRIHRDAEAGEISKQLSALAFTHGPHIYFGSGMYNPGGISGKRLLAHELTHVVQQGQAGLQRRDGSTARPIEAHGDHNAVHRTSDPMIQRTATWAAGPVHEVNNLASAVVNGTAAGVTWPTLNGPTFWSRAAARAALNKPTLKFTTLASGSIQAEVDTLPDNTGSFDETVLAAGPWTTVAPKATIGTMHPTLAACTGAGDSTFRAIGDPSDAEMFAANRRHEDHHADDHEVAFNASILPWDTKLFVAFVLGTTFTGPTQADAEAALYAAMGGTPDQVADAFMDGCQAAVITYHGSAAGGPIGAPTGPTANADCSTSSANYTNPS